MHHNEYVIKGLNLENILTFILLVNLSRELCKKLDPNIFWLLKFS